MFRSKQRNIFKRQRLAYVVYSNGVEILAKVYVEDTNYQDWNLKIMGKWDKGSKLGLSDQRIPDMGYSTPKSQRMFITVCMPHSRSTDL